MSRAGTTDDAPANHDDSPGAARPPSELPGAVLRLGAPDPGRWRGLYKPLLAANIVVLAALIALLIFAL